MSTQFTFGRFVLGLCCAMLLVLHSGCSKQEATEALENAEKAAGDAAETIAEDAGEVVKEGEELAGELSEKAMAYLAPLKEKFGDLDSLKESPEELKKAVTDLIQTIEEKAEDTGLPEKMSNALATVKEKLVALKDYLEGEVEQAKIDEHLKDIADSIKSGLGM